VNVPTPMGAVPRRGRCTFHRRRITSIIPVRRFRLASRHHQMAGYFPDEGPTVVDIGLSSPTAVLFGKRAAFSAKVAGSTLHLAIGPMGESSRCICVRRRELCWHGRALRHRKPLMSPMPHRPRRRALLRYRRASHPIRLYRLRYTGPQTIKRRRAIPRCRRSRPAPQLELEAAPGHPPAMPLDGSGLISAAPTVGSGTPPASLSKRET